MSRAGLGADQTHPFIRIVRDVRNRRRAGPSNDGVLSTAALVRKNLRFAFMFGCVTLVAVVALVAVVVRHNCDDPAESSVLEGQQPLFPRSGEVPR